MIQNPFENERTSVLWNFKNVCFLICWETLKQKSFIYARYLVQKWAKNCAWFKSKD